MGLSPGVKEEKPAKKKAIVKDRRKIEVFWKPCQIVFQKENSEHLRLDPKIW